MLRSTQLGSRSIIVAALAAACTLSLAPSALAGSGHGRNHAGDRRGANPAAHQAEPGPRRAKPGDRLSKPEGRQGRSGGRRGEPGWRHSGTERRHAERECWAPSGAGVLRVNGCSIEIGNNHKYKKIARAFKEAGYHAYVRSDCGVTSVRVYGFPKFDWAPGKFETHTSRQGSVLTIQLCKVGR